MASIDQFQTDTGLGVNWGKLTGLVLSIVGLGGALGFADAVEALFDAFIVYPLTYLGSAFSVIVSKAFSPWTTRFSAGGEAWTGAVAGVLNAGPLAFVAAVAAVLLLGYIVAQGRDKL